MAEDISKQEEEMAEGLLIPEDGEEKKDEGLYVPSEKLEPEEEELLPKNLKLREDIKKPKKYRFNLTAKLMTILVTAVVLLSVFCIGSTRISSKSILRATTMPRLQGYAVSMAGAFATYEHGDFSLTDGVLKKGDADLDAMYEYMDDVSRKTGMTLMVFHGEKVVMTTQLNEDGSRKVGGIISDAVYGKLEKNHYMFNSEAVLDGKKVMEFYYPMMQESTGETIGAFYCAIDKGVASENMSKALVINIAGCVSLTILLIVIGYVIISHLTTAVRHTTDNLDEVANGHLLFSVPKETMERKDEIGDTAKALRTMVNQLRDIVSGILEASDGVAVSTEAMSVSMQRITGNIEAVNSAVEEIASGASSQAADTVQASAGVGKIGVNIRQTASEVKNLNISAQKMDEMSINVDKTLQELLFISKKADEAVAEIKVQTNETNESAQLIQRASDMITEISGQTNLLSLNASIEAARAGEAGTGFAVVADEIRDLAVQSKSSAEEIRDIIDTLIDKSNHSVNIMAEVSESFTTQSQKLDETLSLFTELNSEIKSVMKSIHSIAGQTEELSRLREEVEGVVNNLANVSEANAASAEETAAAMNEVSEILEDCLKKTSELGEVGASLCDNVQSFIME